MYRGVEASPADLKHSVLSCAVGVSRTFFVSNTGSASAQPCSMGHSSAPKELLQRPGSRDRVLCNLWVLYSFSQPEGLGRGFMACLLHAPIRQNFSADGGRHCIGCSAPPEVRPFQRFYFVESALRGNLLFDLPRPLTNTRPCWVEDPPIGIGDSSSGSCIDQSRSEDISSVRAVA